MVEGVTSFIKNDLASFLTSVENMIWSPYVLMPLLMLSAIFFTIATRFVQIDYFKQAVKAVFRNSDEETNGVSSLEAFFIGLASRVGSGNIIGVSLAIAVGGPGVLFWMWLVGLFVAASSFIENTLGQIFKVRETEKGYTGGPAFYMDQGLKNKTVGKVFAFLFSILLVGVYGIAFGGIQANNFSGALKTVLTPEMLAKINVLHLPAESTSLVIGVGTGILLTLLVGYTLFGGAQRIVKVSSSLVPLMTIGYLLLSALVIILNLNQLPGIFRMIFSQAFSLRPILASGISVVVIEGAKKGMFSNEAGMGASPNAAATADVDHPVDQGLVQMLGVYIDTFLVCTVTGLVVLIGTQNLESLATKERGAEIILNALNFTLGDWTGVVLTIFLFFFAFTSIIGNYFYAESALEYLTDKNSVKKILKSILVIFVFIASVISPTVIWSLGEIGMGLLAILNIITIVIIYRFAVSALKDYKRQIKKGKKPIFYEENIPGLKDTVWTHDRRSL